MRILFLNAEVPFPPVGGGMTRTFHELRALSSKHDVTLVGFTYGIPREKPPFPLRVVGVRWDYPPLYKAMHGRDEAASRKAHATLDHQIPVPWLFSYFDSPSMHEALREVVAGSRFDAVVLGDVNMGVFLPLLPRDIPCVLDFQNVYSLMARQAADAAGPGDERAEREAQRTLRFEREVVARCSRFIVCSETDAQAARDMLDICDAQIVPNGVDTTYHQPSKQEPERATILFTGTMSYPPNVEAVTRFVSRILPKIREQVPGVRFEIVGFKPAKEVEKLACKDVVVTGAVPDARPYFRRATVVVVPLTSGGGTRLKVLDAAANGKAIVSTHFGFEGLSFEPSRDILAEDSDEGFAAAVVALINDPEKRRALERNARRAALPYGWDEIETTFLRAIDSLSKGTSEKSPRPFGATPGKARPARAAAVRGAGKPPTKAASIRDRARGGARKP